MNDWMNDWMNEWSKEWKQCVIWYDVHSFLFSWEEIVENLKKMRDVYEWKYVQIRINWGM